jgi:predicted component of type VI protein secretion system
MTLTLQITSEALRSVYQYVSSQAYSGVTSQPCRVDRRTMRPAQVFYLPRLKRKTNTIGIQYWYWTMPPSIQLTTIAGRAVLSSLS